MKWLSATAVFAAVLPSTVLSVPISKELNKNKQGGSGGDFTEKTNSDAGVTYTVYGDVIYSNYGSSTSSVSSRLSSQYPSFSTAGESHPFSRHLNLLESLLCSYQPGSGTSFSQLLASHLLSPNAFLVPNVFAATAKASADLSGGGAFSNPHKGPLTFITNVGAPGSLTLDSINISGPGGAIFSLGPISFDGLKSLTFNNNSSRNSGGALSTNSTLSITNIAEAITFTNNSAKTVAQTVVTDPMQAGNGGAIFTEGATTIAAYGSMLFSNNQASFTPAPPQPEPEEEEEESEEEPAKDTEYAGTGGAICSLGKLSISQSPGKTEFSSNSATGNGGAIFCAESINLFSINSLLFQENTTKQSGSGIYSKGELTINGISESLLFNANSADQSGGAIYCVGDLTISSSNNVVFSTNYSEAPPPNGEPTPTTKSGGGAIYGEGNLSFSSITENLEFSDNQASLYGGNLFANKLISVFNCDKLVVSSGSAGKEGGGIYTPSNVNIFNVGTTIISGNTAEDGNGGGIYANSISFGNHGSQIYGSVSIENNQAKKTTTNNSSSGSGDVGTDKGFGGGIYDNTGTIEFSYLESVNISSNLADGNGGGIYNNNSQQKTNLQTIFDHVVSVTLSSNNGADGGGIHGNVVTFSNIDSLDITNNLAQTYGGGLSSTSITMNNVGRINITDNIAYRFGGGLNSTSGDSTSGDHPKLIFSNLSNGMTVSHNSVQADSDHYHPTLGGGAFYLYAIEFDNVKGTCAFVGNSVTDENPDLPTDTTSEGSGSSSNAKTCPSVFGGALYADNTLSLKPTTGPILSLVFSENSVSTVKEKTDGQIAGGAIYCKDLELGNCSAVFSNNTATLGTTTVTQSITNPLPTLGGAIGVKASLKTIDRTNLTFSGNTADKGSAISCYSKDNNSDTKQISFDGSGTILFEDNIATERGTIFTPSLSITNGSVKFLNNTSGHDGSAIYFTKDCSITAKAPVLFEGNLVTKTSTGTPPASKEAQQSNAANQGAAIFGENIEQTPPPEPANLPLTLTAESGDITFRNNALQATDSTPVKYCSIAGKVKLTLNAEAGHAINFFDSVNVSTAPTVSSVYESLDINKKDSGPHYQGTILFSADLHENKSYIPQKAELYGGTFSLGKSTELHIISFEQKSKSQLVLGPGAKLSTQSLSSGGIIVDNIGINLGEGLVKDKDENNLFTPPALTLVNTNSSSGSSGSVTIESSNNKIAVSGSISIVDPAGNFYQNPALGHDQEIILLKLNKGTEGTITVDKDLILTGDLTPQKGYIGTWELLPSGDTPTEIKAKWTFEQYRRWIYIPRDNHFYVNSILGTQNSMVAVKQGIINNMLNSARFDDAAYNNIWLSGVGSFIQHAGEERSMELSYHTRGFSAAIDAKPRPDFILGAAFSETFGKSKSIRHIDNYHHKGSDHAFQGTLYTGSSFYLPYRRYQPKRPVLLQGVLSFGYIKHDTTTYYPSIHERNIGDWEDLGWLADIRCTIDFKEPTQRASTRLSFYTEVEYASIRQKQFTEVDYDPRFFDNCTFRNLAVPFGLAFEGALMQYNILMYNRLSIGYLPVLYRNTPRCKYRVLSTGEEGLITASIPTRSAGRAEYSTQLYLGPYWTLYGAYAIDAGMYTLTQTANAGARMIF